MDYKKAQAFWDEKVNPDTQMKKEELKERIDSFLSSHNTAALATGTGSYIRNTPVEYTWKDQCIWIMSEGGKKFIGLEKNPNTALAVFEPYGSFGSLKGLQIMGTCQIVEPFSKTYNDFLEYKHIPVAAIKKMPEPMPMLCITPTSFDYLDSSLKKEGYDVRQHLDL